MPEEFVPFIFVFVFFAVFVLGIGITIARVFIAGRKNEQRQQEAAKAYRERAASSSSTENKYTSMTNEQRDRLNYLRQKYSSLSTEDKHERHVADADEHAHAGEEEHYEEIVGSLGEVNDEGCEDLSGVRFIMRDIAYEADDGEETDYTKLVHAMVLGEIINTPRFKEPHRHK